MNDTHGHVAPGYEAVAETFSRNFTEHGEIGAAFAAYHHGELVVDLWGGVADPATGAAWKRDTLQLLFSGTKGLTAACVLWLVERGRLDIDAPVARYWPEFAASGKDAITVSDVLTHRSRLSGVRESFSDTDMLDHDTMAKLLAAQEPTADPRGAFTYHALTFGWLVDEIVRRVDGRTVNELFAAEFAEPLELDIHIGLADEHHHRVAVTVPAPGALLDVDLRDDPDPFTALHHNPLTVTDAPALWNSPGYRRAGLAAVGVHATARAMARFYACLAAGGELDGVRVLDESTVDQIARNPSRGNDTRYGDQMAYGLGFELYTDSERFGPATDQFGHAGFGGSRHAAWPGAGVGVSYAMNLISGQTRDPRPRALLAALHECVPGR